ncbi:MAG TPA: aspartate-semialdehyde dehydrogenase [Candidatus Angelobacter sp.]|jgi:aspartate-semialdehyde dehydrogenase
MNRQQQSSELGNGDALQPVAVFGATGMVGRRLVSLLIDHPHFKLERVVGSGASVGASYRAVWEQKENALQHHYGSFWKKYPVPESIDGMRISSFEELLRSDNQLIFSSVPDRAGEFEEWLVKEGRLVFSNSPHRRFDPDVALVVAEVNGNLARGARLVKNPNCVTSGLLLILAPLASRYGLREVVITTYQSLSGRGDAMYPQDLVLGNIYPLHASAENTEEYIRKEVKKIMCDSFPLSVTCNRTCVQEGHFVEVRIKTLANIESSDEAIEVLSGFNPLGPLHLHSSPRAPVVVLRDSGRPRPLQDANWDDGMAVVVGNLTTVDEVFDLRLTFVVNNLVRGAAGGALLNAELWHATNSAIASVASVSR